MSTATPASTVRNAETMIETPTGLKPVLDVIPDHCYERSTTRGLLLFARDVVIFGLAVWGLLSTNNPCCSCRSGCSPASRWPGCS